MNTPDSAETTTENPKSVAAWRREAEALQVRVVQFQFCIDRVAEALGGVCCGGVDSLPVDQLADPHSTTRVLCDAIAALKTNAARYERARDDDHIAVMFPRTHGHIAFQGEGLDAKMDKLMAAQPPGDSGLNAPKPSGLLWTTRQYSCGCTGDGEGDVPPYCPVHADRASPPHKAESPVPPYRDGMLPTTPEVTEDTYRRTRPPVRPGPDWSCKALAGNIGANDPQDCDWPLCGCDPYADTVIDTLNESNFYVVPGEPGDVMIDAGEVAFYKGHPAPRTVPVMCAEIYEAMVERSQKP